MRARSRARGTASVGARIVAYDTFTRADSTTTLGNAEVGGAWTAVVGTWGILSNQARLQTNSGGGLNFARLSTSYADVTLYGKIGTAYTTSVGLVARLTDANNLYVLQAHIATNKWYLYKRVAGTYTELANSSTVPAIGDRMVWELRGTSHRVWINGAQLFGGTITDSQFTTQLLHGLMAQAGSGGDLLDDFMVSA